MSCIICDRPDVGDINALLRRGHTAYLVAVKYGIKQGTMYRHSQHIPHEGEARDHPPASTTMARFHPEVMRLAAYVDTVRDPATQRLLCALFDLLALMTKE